MSILTKKIFYLTVLAVLLSSSQYLFANVKYWFAGRMIISGNSDLTYTICHWSNTQKKMIQSPLTLSTNTEIDLAALAGGSDYCMKNNLEGTDVGCLEMQWFGTLGTGFILVPNLAFTDFAHPENEPAFQNDLRAGKFAPYIVVERQEGFINIYIVGPTNVSKFVAQKLSFDMKAFENKWINQAYWQPDKLFFAFSFNATTGTFRYSPSKQLSNDAFYIAAPITTQYRIIFCKIFINFSLFYLTFSKLPHPDQLIKFITPWRSSILLINGPWCCIMPSFCKCPIDITS
jgi:hypothetical protein